MWRTLLTVFTILCILNPVIGQEEISGSQRFSARFLEDSTVFEIGKFGFNSVTITNNSQEELHLRMQVVLPEGWDLLRDPSDIIHLRAFEQRIVPLRVRTSHTSYGGKKYFIRASLEDLSTGEQLLTSFSINLRDRSEWYSQLLSKHIRSRDDELLPDFSFIIRNTGNRAQLFEFSMESQLRLSLPSEGNQLILKPGQDSLITVGIRSRNLNQDNDKIIININSRNKIITLEQNVSFIANEVTVNEKNRYLATSAITIGAINLLKPIYTSNYVDFKTEVSLPEDRSLKLRMRTFMVNDVVNIYNSNYLLQYEGKKMALSLGTISDYMYTQINGYGFRARVRKTKQQTEIFGVKSIWYNGFNAGIRQDFRPGKKVDFHLEGLYQNNNDIGIDYGFLIQNVNFKIDPKTELKIKAGYSQEMSAGIGKSFGGYTAGYSFRTQKKYYSINSYFNKSSGWFPGMGRGLESHSHNLMFRNKKVGIGAYGFLLSRSPNVYINNFTNYLEYDNGKTYEYGLQSSFSFRKSVFTFMGGLNYMDQKGQGVRVGETIRNPFINGSKFSVDYKLNSRNYAQQFNIKYGLSELDNTNLETFDFESLNIQANGRIKSLGYQIRLEKGPTYFFDYLYVLNTGKNIDRQQYSIFWNSSYDKNFRFNLSANYSEMKGAYAGTLFMNATVNLDIPSQNLNLRVSSSANVLNQNEIPMLSFSLIKNLDIPVPFFKKYSSLKIKLFKDRNNNKVWDRDEEPVRNATIEVDNHLLHTNRYGEAKLTNTERKAYRVNFNPVDNQIGWQPEKMISDTIKLTESKEVQFAFKTTKTVLGKISYEESKYSQNIRVGLNGITITAENEFGEKYEIITDTDGNFFLNIPPGKYRITCDKSVAGDGYYFEQTSFDIDLNNKDKEVVDFVLKEKVRKINIRKQD